MMCLLVKILHSDGAVDTANMHLEGTDACRSMT